MFHCTICDVKLNSVEQRRAHCRGKNHIKREEARKKAEELGTDFDKTPDHCEVCNVPLTSKMTAIDHFRGKMHQKKVKALEEQRLGFKNYCEICDIRLQSLKVSQAHFNGKLHKKQERKVLLKGKKATLQRKNNFGASQSEDLKPGIQQRTPKFSSSWENLTYDKDSEPKDIFGEFRFLLEKQSIYSDTSSSSSLASSNDGLFCFPKNTDQPTTHPQSSPECEKPNEKFYFTECSPNDSFWNKEDSSNYNSSLLIEFERKSLDIQAILNVLKNEDEGTSSSDISSRIPNLSTYDVNLILNELEKNLLVTKSGYAPILWSLVDSIIHTSYEPLLNQFNQLTVDGNYMQHEKDQIHFPPTTTITNSTVNLLSSSGNVLNNKTSHFSPPIVDKHHEDNHNIHHYDSHIESILLSMFDENCRSITFFEIKNRINFVDDLTLNCILQSLLKRNVITSDGDQRWKRVKSRCNIGVIGEERKRRSPDLDTVQKVNEDVNMSLENNNDTFPSSLFSQPTSITCVNTNERNVSTLSPNTNGCDINSTQNSPGNESSRHRAVATGTSSGISSKHQSVSVEHGRANGLYKRKNISDSTNGFWSGPKKGKANHDFVQSSNERSPRNEKIIQNFPPSKSRCSPPLPMKTTAYEIMDDLILTPLNAYQKEIYKSAMCEDIVSYLPCGTGQNLVMAQVIAHLLILNPSKQAFVIVPDLLAALKVSQFLRKELISKNKRKKINVAVHAGSLKQSIGRVNVSVLTSATCLSLLKCGALSWRDVCLLLIYNVEMCKTDESLMKILQEYYRKSKVDLSDGYIPKLLGFLGSSNGGDSPQETLQELEMVLSSMGDICLCRVEESLVELHKAKKEAMYVCVHTTLSQNESKMFFLLGTYFNLVFDNLAAKWTYLNSYQELVKISFKKDSVNSDAFLKLIELTGQSSDKRPHRPSCMKTWRHYVAICEVIFTLVECGEDLAKELLMNLSRDPCGFGWANNVGLPGFELLRQILMDGMTPSWDPSVTCPRGSGLNELLQQLTIIQWENARVSSERPLALVIVKLIKTANVLANYLSRCPQLVNRNVKTTFIDGSKSPQQKDIISAMKRRQYQVIVTTDNIDDLPVHWELVVLLDLPTTEYALEQLRKRDATNVVAISRDHNGEHQLKQLLNREECLEKVISYIKTGTSSYTQS